MGKFHIHLNDPSTDIAKSAFIVSICGYCTKLNQIQINLEDDVRAIG